MAVADKTPARKGGWRKSRMPNDSVFFEKVVPGLLITLGVVMVLLILVAAGILLGIVPYV